MDFHRLTRRELQTLCKKNKIPANVTNVAMADALKALEIVEGIEEFLNPSESETAQSSIESPEKSEVTSPCVPHTGGRTTRRMTVKDEVENPQTLTTARRSTRKFVVGEVDEKQIRMAETPAATNSRRVLVASARRKMDTQLKEIEEDQKIGKKDISETPGVLQGTRRRGPVGESTVRRTCGTRRSSRLAGKNFENTNLKENEKLEAVKTELFYEESGEILEMNVKECSDDLGEIIEATDIDLKKQLEEGLERNNDKEVNSDEKSDCLIENQIQLQSKFDRVVVRSEMKIESEAVEGDGCDVEYKATDALKAEVYSEICEETDPSADIYDKPVEMADKVEEETGGGELFLSKTEDVFESRDKLDASEEKDSQNIGDDETVEQEVFAQNDAFTTDNKTLKVGEEIMDFIKDEDSGSYDNLSVTDQVIENANMENDMGFNNDAANDLEDDKYLAVFDNNDGGLGKEESGKSLAEESIVDLPQAEEQGMDFVDALESMTLQNTISLAEETTNNNLIEATISLQLNASANMLCEFQPEERANGCAVVNSEKPPTEVGILGAYDGPVSYNALPAPSADGIEEAPVFEFAADPDKMLSSSAENELSHTVLPTCLTPLKKSASKTPVKKSASKKTPTTTKRLSHVFDDKENIDNSGTKPILRKEKKSTDLGQPQYVDISLRKLKKELKETLENRKNSKKDEQVMSSRPALQAVSENIAGE